jgi:arylsulfatase A-like enzyme
MAAEGTRFTQAYCGTSVCAPSRCALMTGLHMGHAPIRANRLIPPEGQMPLPPGTFTVARLLKDAGYDTACIGKWGLGFWGTSGDPNKMGFDLFYGYNCQTKAHDYYPDYLWRNGNKVELGGKTYSQDLMAKETLDWVGQRRDKPFFLYLPYTLPHPTYVIPDLGEYKDKDWTEQEKVYAAMVTRLDHDVGAVLDLLKARGLERDTIVFFASDNGPQGNNRFNSSGGLSGGKRGMSEGSIRVPMIARWPGHVPAGRTREEPWAFWDFLPTCAELAHAQIPAKAPVDGLSVASGLLGGAMPQREYFYWELHEGPCKQAVRFGNWKASRNKPGNPVMLFDLAADPSEKNNLSKNRPDLVARAEALMRQARVDSPDWPMDKPAKTADAAE